MIISPSVLSLDYSDTKSQIDMLRNSKATWLHFDVMDGHFVPNISIGVPVVKSLRKATDLILDTHLMIENPEKYVEPFAKAGSDILTFHYEACKNINHAEDVISLIKSFGMPTADQAALKAVELTAPFRPLPADFKGQSIDIQFTFDYNVFNASRY